MEFKIFTLPLSHLTSLVCGLFWSLYALCIRIEDRVLKATMPPGPLVVIVKTIMGV